MHQTSIAEIKYWLHYFTTFSVGDSYNSSYRCNICGAEFLLEVEAIPHLAKHRVAFHISGPCFIPKRLCSDLNGCKSFGTEDPNSNCQFQHMMLEAGYIMLDGAQWVKKQFWTTPVDSCHVSYSGKIREIWLDKIDDSIHQKCFKPF